MKRTRSLRLQRGVAVVLAMGVAALAAIAVSELLLQQSVAARHGELTVQRAQTRQAVGAAVDWARAVLADDRSLGSEDHLGEAWALRLPPLIVENGKLQGHLEDEQGKFNLNNLVRGGMIDPRQLAHFRRLLAVLGLPSALAPALADWIDADSEEQPGGGEDAHYLARTPPYLAANRMLADTAELALVRGFDAGVLERLAPHVTALPRFTPVNVNTATPEVLAALVDGLSLAGARTVIAQRGRKPLRDRADFRGLLPLGLAAAENDIATSSEYFSVHAEAVFGDARTSGLALLARRGAGWPAILWMKSS